MIGIDFGAAVVAAPKVAAERVSPAGHDVRDGALVRWQHCAAMRRKVAVRKAAEHVRDFNHGCGPRSEAAHHLIKERFERAARRFDQMRVPGRRRNVDVAQRTRVIMHLILSH